MNREEKHMVTPLYAVELRVSGKDIASAIGLTSIRCREGKIEWYARSTEDCLRGTPSVGGLMIALKQWHENGKQVSILFFGERFLGQAFVVDAFDLGDIVLNRGGRFKSTGAFMLLQLLSLHEMQDSKNARIQQLQTGLWNMFHATQAGIKPLTNIRGVVRHLFRIPRFLGRLSRRLCDVMRDAGENPNSHTKKGTL